MVQTKKAQIKTAAVIMLLLFISACAKTDTIILQKDISRYSAIEEELNLKIKLLNSQMIDAIADYKRSGSITQFEKDFDIINQEISQLLQLAKEVNIHIASKDVKKYHQLTIKLLEVQAEYVKVSIEEFKTLGEHGNNDAKSTQIKYNKKIRALQKEQDKLLEKIINKINDN